MGLGDEINHNQEDEDQSQEQAQEQAQEQDQKPAQSRSILKRSDLMSYPPHDIEDNNLSSTVSLVRSKPCHASLVFNHTMLLCDRSQGGETSSRLEDFSRHASNNRFHKLNGNSSLEVDKLDALADASMEEKIARLIDERSGRIDLSRAVSCDLCDRRFISEDYLNKHIKELHPTLPRVILNTRCFIIKKKLIHFLISSCWS